MTTVTFRLAVLALLAAVAAGCSTDGPVVIGSAGTLVTPASDTPTQARPFRRPGEIAVVTPSGRQILGIRRTGATRVLATCAPPCRRLASPAWSPDGRWLAYAVDTCGFTGPCSPQSGLSQSGLWARTRGGQPRQLTSDCSGERCGVDRWRWRPDGALIADARASTPEELQLQLIDPATGWTTPLARLRMRFGAISWSPDSRSLALGVPTGLDVVDTAVGALHPVLAGASGVGTVAWSPNGRRIAYDSVGVSGSAIGVANADGTGHTVIEHGTNFEGPGMPAWAPDGRRLAYVTTPGRPNHYRVEVWTATADGAAPTLLYRTRVGAPDFGPPLWSPDGSLVVLQVPAAGPRDPWLAVPADGHSAARRISDLVVERWLQRPGALQLPSLD